MNDEARKAVLFFAVTVAVGLVVVVFGTRVLGLAAGPESEIITLLKKTESSGLSLPVGQAEEPLRSTRHHFERIVVEADPETRAAQVATTLDFEGRFGDTIVSSLGLETLRLQWEDGEWRSPGGLAPRLSEITTVLEARRRALESGDLDALAVLSGRTPEALGKDPALTRLLEVRNRRYSVSAWYVRSERDEVLVGEDWRLEGDTPERPVDQKGTRRLSLERSGSGYLFDAGVM